ncbi:MAG: dimethylamine monooxygenase subunit DmmA family protein [Amylibacter sp.]|jgi:predicted RNA-binding Zn-ribbon protein involved in translation (DUF1610 family)
MTIFKFPESIKSRPTYGKLEYREGKSYLFIADADGAEAIIELANDNKSLMAKSHIIYIPNQTGDKYISKLDKLDIYQLYIGPSYSAAQSRIIQAFEQSHMGLQVYLAGTEGLIGQALRDAMAAGIPHTFIQSEHRGSVARRMQCVHCKGITEDVINDPFVCSHCGLNLFVRDHYSRRLAAFQGVCIDAEDPGNVPTSVELYK